MSSTVSHSGVSSSVTFVVSTLIHTSVFKPHSTRAAASSARDNSVLVDETLQSAG